MTNTLVEISPRDGFVLCKVSGGGLAVLVLLVSPQPATRVHFSLVTTTGE
jgi:hypothetical protein